MHFEDEKDYLMRIMKEAISVLFSFLLGKTYVSVELERENHYQVSGRDLNGLLEMIDQGQINEAENILLGRLDYRNQHEVAAATLAVYLVEAVGPVDTHEADHRQLNTHTETARTLKVEGIELLNRSPCVATFKEAESVDCC